jgi:hypothetical protein
MANAIPSLLCATVSKYHTRICVNDVLSQFGNSEVRLTNSLVNAGAIYNKIEVKKK